MFHYRCFVALMAFSGWRSVASKRVHFGCTGCTTGTKAVHGFGLMGAQWVQKRCKMGPPKVSWVQKRCKMGARPRSEILSVLAMPNEGNDAIHTSNREIWQEKHHRPLRSFRGIRT
jgi:hypothetical protein